MMLGLLEAGLLGLNGIYQSCLHGGIGIWCNKGVDLSRSGGCAYPLLLVFGENN
jgi:hypothetical protein